MLFKYPDRAETSCCAFLLFVRVGGAFDPLGWSKGDVEDLKVKELKNGRLAMLAFLGFVAQYGATGERLLYERVR